MVKKKYILSCISAGSSYLHAATPPTQGGARFFPVGDRCDLEVEGRGLDRAKWAGRNSPQRPNGAKAKGRRIAGD